MGSGSSNQGYTGVNELRYATPKMRAARREKRAEDIPVSPLIDPSANKFDYLIVFEKTRRDKIVTVNERTGLRVTRDDLGADEDANDTCCGTDSEGLPIDNNRRVYWNSGPESCAESVNAYLAWQNSVPGDSEEKEEALQQLEESWKAFLGVDAVFPTQNISFDMFLEMTRDLIISMILKKSGLQVKLTTRKVRNEDGRPVQRVFCRLRATVNQLEQKAASMKYRLQFRREVDPGTEFWTKGPEEMDLENTLIPDRMAANEQLESMYEKGYIKANDVQVFVDEPTPKHWTRRIRTLERIADRVPCTNVYPAYCEYGRNPVERHLFEEYASVRGYTLFQPKDRLFLTRVMLDEVFDFAVLDRVGIIDSIFPLHDSNRGEALTVASFSKRWVFFFLGDRDKIGSPYVSHSSTEASVRCPWYLAPWAQPHMEIREYFGEQVALYFAWVGFYGISLLVPAFFGVILEAYRNATGSEMDSEGIKWYEVLFALLLVLWAVRYNAKWQIEEKVCAVKWGTSGFEDSEGDRPQFHGDQEESWFFNALNCCQPVAEEKRLSTITLHHETYYPEGKRSLKASINLFAIMIMIVMLFFVIYVNEYITAYLEDEGYSWATYVMALEAAMQIKLLSGLYDGWVQEANDWENHQTDTKYEDALIAKTFLFQVFNNYGAAWFIAFVRSPLFGCTSNNCIHDVKQLLMAIFAVRFAMVIFETVMPYVNSSTKNDEAQEDAAEFLANATPIKIQVAAYLGKRNELVMSYKEGQDEETGRDLYRGLDEKPLIDLYQFLQPDNLETFLGDLDKSQGFTKHTPAIVTLVCKQRRFGSSEIASQIESVQDMNVAKKKAVYDLEALKVMASNAVEAGKSEKLSEFEPFEYEYFLDEFESMFGDYAAIVLQMGYVVMFSLCWSYLPLLAMFEVLLQIRGDAFAMCSLRRRPDPSPAEDVGYWSVLMSTMGFVAVFTNTAVICFTSNSLEEYSLESQFLVWLIMEHVFLVIRYMFSSGLTDLPLWLDEVIHRQAFVVDKHTNIKSSGGDSDDGPAPSGNLDADDMNLGSQAVTLTPARQTEVEYLKEQLRLVDSSISDLRRELKKASAGEIWNEDTQVSESAMVPGLALGMVNLQIHAISGVGTHRRKLVPENTRVVVSIRDKTNYNDQNPKPYDGTPGPAPVVTKKGSAHKTRAGICEINQSLQLAPIKSGKAEVVFDVVDAESKKKRGQATIALAQLKDQIMKEMTPKIVVKGDAEAEGLLSVKAQFQYSKVKPIKERMYKLFEKKRDLERDVTNIVLGKKPEREWDFPNRH